MKISWAEDKKKWGKRNNNTEKWSRLLISSINRICVFKAQLAEMTVSSLAFSWSGDLKSSKVNFKFTEQRKSKNEWMNKSLITLCGLSLTNRTVLLLPQLELGWRHWTSFSIQSAKVGALNGHVKRVCCVSILQKFSDVYLK